MSLLASISLLFDSGAVPTSVKIIAAPLRDKYDWITWWGAVLLSVVGIVGVCVAVITLFFINRQVNEMRLQRKAMNDTLGVIQRQADLMEKQAAETARQTDHLKDSVAAAVVAADASRDSLVAMKSKERARLSIEIDRITFDPHPMVYYKLNCHGTTPAYITATWHLNNLLQVSDYEWDKDTYGAKLTNFPTVVSASSVELYTFIMQGVEQDSVESEVMESIAKGDSYIHFRIRISYKDIFGEAHSLCVAKIYGIMPQYKDPLSQSIWKAMGSRPSPNWYDSKYKYNDAT